VPGADAAKALIDTVGTLANLGGIALGQAPQVAAIVKTGVENILGLNDAKLQVGVSDSFFPPDPNGTGGNPLRTGAYVGIAAEARQVDAGRLWLVDGRLKAGDDPVQAANYDAFDYMVVSVERRDRRDDWPGLPGVADFQDKFGAIMADGALPVPDKKKRMGELWPAFTQALAQSMYLTQPDREAIAADVSKDLNARLKAMEANNPFETRSWGQKAAARKPPAEFDFVDVPEYTDVASPNSRKEARAAWAGKPFGP
jgi:hypothetical protein